MKLIFKIKKITTVDGYQMLVNPYDHYICRDLANDGQWEPHIRKVLNNVCKSGMNFIDIGANDTTKKYLYLLY